MMTRNKNLVIGYTSQLSHYFPKNDHDFVSSRNIDYDIINERKYERIYLLFAEQRTFLNNSEDLFINVNVNYTLEVIDKLKDNCGKIIIYSTSELWNNYNEGITINMEFNYNYSPYIRSKEILCNLINSNRNKYNNVIIIYPFNFNSPHRSSGFLFTKIFDSIINKTKIEIGNVDFYRDLIHPSVIVRESISTNIDKIIGCGELINVKNFIIDLYKNMNLNVFDYITFDEKDFLHNKRKEYYSKEKYSNYTELINLTIKDIYEYSIS